VAAVAADASFAITVASFDISDNSSRQAADPSGAQVLGAAGAWLGGMVFGLPGAVGGGLYGAALGDEIENPSEPHPESYRDGTKD